MDASAKKTIQIDTESLSNGCFNHHNNMTKCNSSEYNGRKCEYIPAGKHSAAICSPINVIKKTLTLKLGKKIQLLPKDISTIKKIREHDKHELKTIRHKLKKKKDIAKEQKDQLSCLLKTLYVERKHHKETLHDFNEKFKLLKSNYKKEKNSLKEYYNQQLHKYEQDFSKRNSSITTSNESITTPRKRNITDYNEKIEQLKQTCLRENNRLKRHKKDLLQKYNDMKTILEKKTSEISQDSTNLSNQYKLVKDRLKILERDEDILREHIQNFNRSKDEYIKLISSLKLSTPDTGSKLKELTSWLEQSSDIERQTIGTVQNKDVVEETQDESDTEKLATQIDQQDLDTALLDIQSDIPSKDISNSRSNIEQDNESEKQVIDIFRRNSKVQPNTEFHYDTQSLK